ncbi:MAG: D-alanine--D-alanine ligase [Chitinophagaceae bacterium]|nr:D-alanine--D-alanine ligase [Chitinophagaceae bacterium]
MKKNIALVTGGYSDEAVISYKSAETIYRHIDRDRYNVYYIDICHKGWFYKKNEEEYFPVNKNDFSVTVGKDKIVFDGVFIGMHGTPGEDGKLQGYFDMLNIPYTGCGAAVSALTFNKRYAVCVAGQSGIPVAASVLLRRDNVAEKRELLKQLHYPVFVKPNNGGSSIGMSKVKEAHSGLEEALQKAFREDEEVLVEEMIPGREFTVGVYRYKGKITVLPLTEIRAHSSQDFFDYEAKYGGKSTEVTPADTDEAVAEKLRQTARSLYEIFNCRGVVRIDFILHESKQIPYMLEINTVPGQSEASIIPQQVKAAGLTLTEFYGMLLEELFQ